MTWNDWLKDGRIEAHRPVREEIVAQRRAAERSLADAALPGLSPEGRFRLAYDAGLALTTLAVIHPDLRGVGGSTKEDATSGPNDGRPGVVVPLAYLQAPFDVDPLSLAEVQTAG